MTDHRKAGPFGLCVWRMIRGHRRERGLRCRRHGTETAGLPPVFRVWQVIVSAFSTVLSESSSRLSDRLFLWRIFSTYLCGIA